MAFLSHRRLSRLDTFLLHDVSVTGRKQIRNVLCLLCTAVAGYKVISGTPGVCFPAVRTTVEAPTRRLLICRARHAAMILANDV